MSYLYQRKNNFIEMLFPKHDWVVVYVQDGTTEAESYHLKLAEGSFTVEDPAAGADSSAAIATSFISLINSSSHPLRAIVGPTAESFRVRHMQVGGQLHAEGTSSSAEGRLRVMPTHPDTYSINVAPNWDAVTPTLGDTISWENGKISRTVATTREQLDALRINRNQVSRYTRYILDPADIGGVDENVSYLQTVPNFGPTAITDLASPLHMILTPEQFLDSHTMLALSGSVPAGASYADALILELPRQCSSYEIRNLGGADLFVSFGSGTSELTVASGDTIRDNRLNVSVITLRGDGVAVEVNLAVTLNAQRML
jgi:hypothetical protein